MTIENHCTLKMPPMSRYTLVRTDELPKDYIIEPLKKDLAIASKKRSSKVTAYYDSSNMHSPGIRAFTFIFYTV